MSGSITQLIDLARDGNDDALSDLHRRYWPRLVRLARQRMGDWRARVADVDDIVQGSFITVCDSLRQGKVPQLRDRNDFLAFLSHVVACQVFNEIKKQTAAKRGGGHRHSPSSNEAAIDPREYTPIQNAILKETFNAAIGMLPEQLREFAQLHLAGLSNREIADRIDCTQRTVERKLAVIRLHWQKLAVESVAGDLKDLLGAI